MSQPIEPSEFTKELLALLKETFMQGSGIYLDKDTSLLETVDQLTAKQASHPLIEGATTIASQLDHVRFYIQTINDYMDSKKVSGIDWSQSWKRKVVTDAEWSQLRKQLREDYDKLCERLRSFDDWNDEKRLGGALADVVHSAYHLGAIRQILHTVGSQA
jgi:hypothetical protein